MRKLLSYHRPLVMGMVLVMFGVGEVEPAGKRPEEVKTSTSVEVQAGILVSSPTAASIASLQGARWKKEGQEIRLEDKGGSIMRSIKLGREGKVKKVTHGQGSEKKEYEIWDVKEVYGEVSGDGENMAILTREEKYGWDQPRGSTTSIRYIDKNNEVLWEWENVDVYRGARISQDGSRVAFIEIREQVMFSPPIVDQWVVVFDKQGQEMIKEGPFEMAGQLFLTRNGKFGYVKAYFPETNEFGFIFFDVDRNKVHAVERLAGWVKLSESGKVTVERGGRIYLDGRIERGKIVYEFSFK